MLNAGKKVAEEVIDTGEKIIEAQEEAQPVDPSVEQPLDAKETSDQEVIETLQNVISAANEVIEATNQALSKSLDAQKQ
jgi:heterodisulfide reductase subunit C